MSESEHKSLHSANPQNLDPAQLEILIIIRQEQLRLLSELLNQTEIHREQLYEKQRHFESELKSLTALRGPSRPCRQGNGVVGT